MVRRFEPRKIFLRMLLLDRRGWSDSVESLSGKLIVRGMEKTRNRNCIETRGDGYIFDERTEGDGYGC
jgi:hypothetical protein